MDEPGDGRRTGGVGNFSAADAQPVMKSVGEAWAGFPAATRNWATAIALGWFLTSIMGIEGAGYYYAASGQNLVRLYLWSFLTYIFVEPSLLQALLSAVIFLQMGGVLEPIWGAREFTTFHLTVGTATGVLLCSLRCLLSLLVGGILPDYYCGALGMFAASTVALKQLKPDTIINLFMFPLRLQYLPLALIGVTAVFDFLLGSGDTATVVIIEEGAGPEVEPIVLPRRALSTPLVITSVLVAWAYLRFFQAFVAPGGDQSAFMAFETFFPTAAQPTARAVAGRLRPFLMPVVARLRAGIAQDSQPDPESQQSRADIDHEEVRRRAGEAALGRNSDL